MLVRTSNMNASLGMWCLVMLPSAVAFLTSPQLDHEVTTFVARRAAGSLHPLPAPLFFASKSKPTAEADASNNTTASQTPAWDELSETARNMWETIRDAPDRFRVKQELILMGASYDRGFGASPSARRKVTDMVDELVATNPCQHASRNIDGKEETTDVESPLKGNWRLVWTTAQDILALNASPFTVVGAIHQVVEPPIITNIVDFIPRAQELVAPDKIRSTLFRGKVKTKASASKKNNPLTVDVTFESVNVKAVEVLGRKIGSALPALAMNLPKLPGTPSDGNGSSLRHLDIVYLDKNMLITKQNAPGGTNVFVKVDDAEV